MNERKEKRKKWYHPNVLNGLKKRIKRFVDNGDYSSIPSFINDAIREKLEKEERRLMERNNGRMNDERE